MRKTILLTFLLCATLITCSQDINREIQNTMRDFGMVSLGLCVIKDGSTVFKESYGYRDREEKMLNTTDTYYRVASVSKMFTAMGVIKALEHSGHDTDTEISEFFEKSISNPFFPDISIRISHLLTHTSSVSESGGSYVRFVREFFRRPVNLTELLSPGGKWYERRFFRKEPPGHDFHYSNLGYVILGTIIEKLTGKRFDIYMKEEIFDRSGTKTTFNPESIKHKKSGKGYINDEGFVYPSAGISESIPDNDMLSQYKVGSNALVFSPQSGMWTSIDDMETFIYNLSGHTLPLKKEGSPRTKHTEYCHGVRKVMSILPGRVFYGHTGSSFGVTSGIFFDQEHKNGVGYIITGAGLVPDSRKEFFLHERKLFSIIREYFWDQ